MTIVTEICEILKRSVHLADFDKGVMQWSFCKFS